MWSIPLFLTPIVKPYADSAKQGSANLMGFIQNLFVNRWFGTICCWQKDILKTVIETLCNLKAQQGSIQSHNNPQSSKFYEPTTEPLYSCYHIQLPWSQWHGAQLRANSPCIIDPPLPGLMYREWLQTGSSGETCCQQVNKTVLSPSTNCSCNINCLW